ncbi:DUF4129 domain-containing protein [Phycicoccus sp. MAQZ13P-2]|uniref:DUF4129 domain-containing protein n=1 Tax=Phycicoccus mangrovi TaxID=2840470 RepID=UPI001C0066F2|nr:DUF4129 domain-containing protein [Phycicoccus mangrovi]MBT9255750.1 DUF4129 domain-containing protein [Phycicoccus mangrovi]MBT9274344.1 DUF4129 domain-containing protein [Phycicoccus mangrovi]
MGDARRGDRARWSRVALGATAAAAALLAVWAASVPGIPRVISGPHLGPVTQYGADDDVFRPSSEVDARAFRSASVNGDSLAALVGWTAVGLVGLALLVVLVLVLRALLRSLQGPRAVEADDTAGPDLARLGTALTDDAEERLVVLGRGTPAEGIIAAWDRLEDTLRAAGLTLSASRTSTETAVGVLRRFEVDEETLQSLAALYREAAWSRHELTEDHRATAETALTRLAADLRAATERQEAGSRA